MSEKSWPGLSNGEVSQSWGERYGYICQMIPSKFQFRRCTRRWHILILVQQCLTVHRVNRISLSKQPIRQLRNTFWRRIQMLTGLQQLREGLNLHNLFVIILLMSCIVKMGRGKSSRETCWVRFLLHAHSRLVQFDWCHGRTSEQDSLVISNVWKAFE